MTSVRRSFLWEICTDILIRYIIGCWLLCLIADCFIHLTHVVINCLSSFWFICYLHIQIMSLFIKQWWRFIIQLPHSSFMISPTLLYSRLLYFTLMYYSALLYSIPFYSTLSTYLPLLTPFIFCTTLLCSTLIILHSFTHVYSILHNSTLLYSTLLYSTLLGDRTMAGWIVHLYNEELGPDSR